MFATLACGPPPQAPAPAEADFISPTPKPGEFNQKESREFAAAWREIVSGRTDRAVARLRTLRRARADRPSVEAALGFAALRDAASSIVLQDARAAFARSLALDPSSVSALVGAAAVERREGKADAALELLTRAEQLAPADGLVGRRLGEAKLTVAERALASVASLTAAGREDEARAMLRRALAVAPELATARVDLASRLLAAAAPQDAIAVLRAAPAPDRDVGLALGRLLRATGDTVGAEAAFQSVLALSPDDPEATRLIEEIAAERQRLALPEPLRDLAAAARITRAELSALIVLRVPGLRGLRGTPAGVASDLQRTWAREYAVRAIELGILELYPNHTFQPSAIVRRGELARAVARVLDLIRWPSPMGAPPNDMSPSHLQFAGAIRAIGAGLMLRTPQGAFEPWRIVSGAEAENVVGALGRLGRADRGSR